MKSPEKILLTFKDEIRTLIDDKRIGSAEEALEYIIDHYQLYAYFGRDDPRINWFFSEVRLLFIVRDLPVTDRELMDRPKRESDISPPPEAIPEAPDDKPFTITLRLSPRIWYHYLLIFVLKTFGLKQD